MQKPTLNLMKAAIETAEANQTPFGSALAMGDEVFATASHQPEETGKKEAHACYQAIRKLSEHLQKTDLSGFALYSTCEPCEHCRKEAIRANIKTIYFGCGFSEVLEFFPQTKSGQILQQEPELRLVGGVCFDQCRELLKQYKS